MFYKFILDGDWFTFAKQKDSVSQPCYSFMPTSTYPKEWKSKFIFVSAAMIPESPPLRDAKAAIEDSCVFCVEMTLWGLLQGDCKDVKFVVGDKVEPGMSRGVERRVAEGSIQAGESAAGEKDEEASSDEKKGPPGSFQARSSSDDDDEDLESRLARKRKTASPKQVPAPRDIRLRLRSASGKKAFPATKVASELPPTGVKGSLSKHLRSSSLVSEPLLASNSPPFFLYLERGSSNAPIEIPTAPSSSCVRDKTPEVSAARIVPAFEISPHHTTGTSKPSHFEGFVSRSPLSPLFADALPVPYIPRWKITQSSVVGTPETAQDFLAHVRMENEGLKSDLKTSQTITTELRCQVVDAERKLQEEKGAGVMLEQKERAWAREMAALVEEKEEAYRDVGYQVSLKDGYAYSAQGLRRKETPLYNSKAKKRLSKLDKEFGGKAPALLEKILERPLMSIDEVKALLTPAGPSSPKSLSGDDSQ
ncbi:hypothetical protein HanLR1_Chr10g0351961 [Helianthus annuus]|nr:hypothetical protein HanLR1_Chr10g0351961 [Helianthus annuus]